MPNHVRQHGSHVAVGLCRRSLWTFRHAGNPQRSHREDAYLILYITYAELIPHGGRSWMRQSCITHKPRTGKKGSARPAAQLNVWGLSL